MKLDDEQRKALEGLLASTNLVSVFRGGAGTGKSFVLYELVERLRQAGRPVVVLAPQRQQVVDMEKAGFPSPATVASFLTKGELPERAVVVVDEAGQLGGRQMLALLRLAKERNARVVLSGDTRQHGAVEASDALLGMYFELRARWGAERTREWVVSLFEQGVRRRDQPVQSWQEVLTNLPPPASAGS